MLALLIDLKRNLEIPKNIRVFLNDTHREKLDSVQERIKVKFWLLLIFFDMFTQSIKVS